MPPNVRLVFLKGLITSVCVVHNIHVTCRIASKRYSFPVRRGRQRALGAASNGGGNPDF